MVSRQPSARDHQGIEYLLAPLRESLRPCSSSARSCLINTLLRDADNALLQLAGAMSAIQQHIKE